MKPYAFALVLRPRPNVSRKRSAWRAVRTALTVVLIEAACALVAWRWIGGL